MFQIFPTAAVRGFGNGNGNGMVPPQVSLELMPSSQSFWDKLTGGFIHPGIPEVVYASIPAGERDAYRDQWAILSPAERQVVIDTFQAETPPVYYRPPEAMTLNRAIVFVNSALDDVQAAVDNLNQFVTSRG